MKKVAPSILSADFNHLGRDIENLKANGADYVHFDVMDGTFVPNLTFGAPVMRWAAKCPLKVDAHLMVEHPETFIEDFARAGAKIITVHAEAAKHLNRVLHLIREAGCLAGVALNPATSPDCLRYSLGAFDLALVMTVNPGFGGQKMIPATLDKISEIRKMLDDARVEAMIQVDGGVNERTAVDMIRHGADFLVAGSALFGAPDAGRFIESIRASWREIRG